MNKNNMDTKEKLSLLWIFVMFNYLYCDVIGLHDSATLKQLMTGSVGSLQITEKFLFAGSILMEIPIAMVLLSRILEYRANRWANIIAGTIKTVVMISTMFLDTPALYYVFFGTIEIACTSYIVWYAWKWTEPEAVSA